MVVSQTSFVPEIYFIDNIDIYINRKREASGF